MARRRRFGGSRSRRLVTAGLAATAGVVMLAGPVPAMGVTQPGESPCLASTGSLTLSASTVYAGQSVSASFTTQRAHNCEGVLSGVFGPGASVWGGVSGGGGTFTPSNMGVNNYTVTVFFPGGSVDVAWGSVTVQPPPDSISDPALMCVGAAGGNSADGTQVELENCNGTAGQQWATPGNDATIQVMGKCLTPAGGGITRGTAVQLAACDGSAGQVWANTSNSPSSNSALFNPISGLCLDATGASTAAGTPLQLWNCTSGDGAQLWTWPQGGSSIPSLSPGAVSNSATAAADGTVLGVVPRITCTLTVEDPELLDSGPQPKIVGAHGHTECDYTVLHLRQWHQLVWLPPGSGIPRVPATDNEISRDNLTAETFPSWDCDAGRWTSTAEDLILWPLGFTPRVSIIIAPNPDALDLVKRQCLGNNTGVHLRVAEAQIQAQGFTVGTVTMQPSNTVPFDIVTAQNLESDNQTVDLVVSEGNHTVPDLIGDEEAYALSDIDEDGLIAGNDVHRYDCISPGDVEGQTPGAGTYFDPANPPTVNITVSDCDGTPK